MATRVETVLVCDVCGDEGPTVKTREFGLDGQPYEAEVCDREWAKARKPLAGVADVGRVVKPQRRRASSRSQGSK